MMMHVKQWRQISRWVVLAGCVVSAWMAPGATETHPSFEEVSGLIRSNLSGATPAEIDWMAVEGLLKELSPRVSLGAGDGDPISSSSDQPSLKDSQIYRDNVGYVQFAYIREGAAASLRERYLALETSNYLSGLVLDLRGAVGDDYAAALKVADLFLGHEVPLLNWGEGLKSSQPKSDAITLPVAVLVDGKTGGSAEALAGMLRQSGVGLLLGERTAGTAGIKRAHQLQNGQFLWITVSSVQLGDARLLSADGLKPDVDVEPAVRPRNETSATGDVVGAGSATNSSPGTPRLRMDEADLVRRWRGEMLSAKDMEKPSVVNGPETRDAVLVRALDLMDGLAILRSWQR